MFIAALFTIAKLWRQPKCSSVVVWVKMRWCTYTMEYYLAIKNKILPLMTAWMDMEGIMFSEIKQKQKDKYHTISFICGI